MDKPRKRGRASKLTPETQARIVEALEAGSYFGAACEAAGIDESTGYRWMDRGERGEAGYREFREAVKRAEAVAEVGALAAIRSAYQGGTWQAAAWYLERKRPERWGKLDRAKLEPVEESGSINALMDALNASRDAARKQQEDEARKQEAAERFTPEQLARMYREAADSIEDGGTPGH